MSERYTKVFALPANMYAENAPVVIELHQVVQTAQKAPW